MSEMEECANALHVDGRCGSDIHKKKDVDTIARKLSDDFEKLHGMRLGWVTARFEESLREYGKAEYRRGVEETRSILVKQWSAGSAECFDKKHRPTCHYETAVYVNNKIEELQRGTEAGK